MSNSIRKSSLEQAKADFEEIRNFAQQQIENKLQEEVDKKILAVINEEINISVDEDGVVEISKDGEEVITLDPSNEEGDLDSSDEENQDSEEEFIVSDEEEPISVSDEEELTNENMLEMDGMTNEAEEVAGTPAPAVNQNAEVAPAVEPAQATSEPIEKTTAEEPAAEGDLNIKIDELISTLSDLVDVMKQQQGSTEEGGDKDFVEVIDDESQAQPTEEPVAEPTPEEVAPAPAPAPVQEELTFEIEEFEEGHDILEIIDEEEDDSIEIADEDQIEEIHGVGHNLRHSNRLGKLPHQGVEHRSELNENKKIKAQYESKIGELVKENKGLQTELKSLKLERKEFEEAFIQLREQFDEMQTFNGKLALVNKLLMNGGLSFEQKLNVCEQFDGADSIEDAEKIYKSIIKENNIKVNDASNKIKASTTHTAKANTESKPLYESEEARRMKQLAGMSKRIED